MVDDDRYCRKYGMYDSTTERYGGIVGVLQRREADTLLVPFPIDVDGRQVLDYSPVSLYAHTALMTIYNTSYRNLDVISSFSSFDAISWMITSLCMMAIGLILYQTLVTKVDAVTQVVSMMLGQGVDDRVIKLTLKPSFAMFFVALFFLISIFCNMISSNAATVVSTDKFDSLDELIASPSYSPIWIRHMMYTGIYYSNNRDFLEKVTQFVNAIISVLNLFNVQVYSAVKNKSDISKFERLRPRDCGKLFDPLRKEKYVLVSVNYFLRYVITCMQQ